MLVDIDKMITDHRGWEIFHRRMALDKKINGCELQNIPPRREDCDCNLYDEFYESQIVKMKLVEKARLQKELELMDKLDEIYQEIRDLDAR